MRKIDKIIIHCAATKPSMDVGVKEIRDWHVRGNGWTDVGYHFVIRRDGTLELGRPAHQPGAHTAGHNQNSIGICLVGGVKEDGKTPENNFTENQWATLETVVKEQKDKYPGATIHGHNEFAKKACPSFNVQDWLKTVNL